MKRWKARHKLTKRAKHAHKPQRVQKQRQSHKLYSDDIEHKELFDIHSTEYFANAKQCQSKHNTMTKNIKSCQYYNPYFCSGCIHGEECQFTHLTESEFLRYCYYKANHCVDENAANNFRQAMRFINKQLLAKALPILKQLVLQYELNGVINFWYARIHHLRSDSSHADMNTAQFYYRKAISILPSNATFHSYYAQFSTQVAKRLKLRVRCSEYKQAKEHYRKSLKIRSNPKVHFMFAKFLDEVENEYIDAQNHYQEALSVLADDVRLRLNYARCLHKMEEYELSKNQFEIIFKIGGAETTKHNSLLWPHFHFGRLLTEMQFYEQAKEQFNICCKLMDHYNNRYFSEIYYEFAQLLCLHLKDYENALYFIDTAIEISPQRRYYKKLLYQIEDKIKAETHANPEFNVDDDKDNNENEENEEESIELLTNEIKSFSFATEQNMHHPEDDDPENEFLANRFCASAFDRFISCDVSFGAEFETYCDQFEEEEMNDIRLLLYTKKITDEKWLRDKIGMNEDSIRLWIRSVKLFQDQYEIYVSWLRRNGFYRKYFKKFETYGILSLQSFFHHIKNAEDVLYIIRDKNKNDAGIIWKSAQKEMNGNRQITDEHKQQLL